MAAKSHRRVAARSAKSTARPSVSRSDARPSSRGALLSLTQSGLNALRARLEKPAEHAPVSKGKADSAKHHLVDALERLRADYERVLKAD
jgi:hypothetical protein